MWMDAVAAHLDALAVRRILDLGCGTGRFAQPLAARFDAEVVGIDPSEKMLAVARGKAAAGIRYVRAVAESLPLEAGSVDVVFASMSLHHWDEPERAARECRRVVRPDGAVFIRNGTREQMLNYAYVPFLPSSRAILEDVLPRVGDIVELFERAEFRFVAHDVLRQQIASDWVAYAEKLAAGGDSVIAQIDPAELARGLDAIRGHVAPGPDQTVSEPIDLLVLR